MERIHKLIGNSGILSRRKAEEYIKQGRITCNGKRADIGQKATWEDSICIDGKRVKPNKKYYYILHKPRSVISSTSDDKNRTTVIDLIENAPKGLHPIGRLDYDTTGLLLLTTDGEVTNLLTNSAFGVPKTYIVKTKDKLSRKQLDMLENGVIIDKIKTRNAKVRPIKREWSDCFIRITITEGKNHQVKKMIEAVGSKVVKLHRERIGNLDIAGINVGIYKRVTLDELQSMVGYRYFQSKEQYKEQEDKRKKAYTKKKKMMTKKTR